MDRGRRAAAGAFPMADLRGGLLLYLPLPPVKGASPVAFPDIQRSSCAVGHMRLYGAGLSWWLADVKESQKYMFTSSIGNINTYTAYLAIGLSISGAYAVYRGRQGKWGGQEGAALLAVFFLFSIALATGRSDNAVAGAAAFFLAVPAGIRDTRQRGI